MNPIPVPGRVRRTVAASAVAGLALVAGSSPALAATAPSAEVIDGTLSVEGSPAVERIALRLDALDANRLLVDFGDDGTADAAFDRTTFDAIHVDAGSGDDTVRIDQVNGIFTTTERTRVDGGNGDDTLLGGSGGEILVGGNGTDLVDGNAGADTGLLGRGDDVFVWDQGDGSDVVEGGSGADAMVFNGFGASEAMAATANGGRVLFTRVQGGIVMNLDDVETIDVRPLGGADTVTVNDTAGTDLERVEVDLAASLGASAPDFAADVVRVVGTEGDDTIAATADGAVAVVSGLAAVVRVGNADATADTLAIDSLGGVDSISIDPALGGLVLVKQGA